MKGHSRSEKTRRGTESVRIKEAVTHNDKVYSVALTPKDFPPKDFLDWGPFWDEERRDRSVEQKI